MNFLLIIFLKVSIISSINAQYMLTKWMTDSKASSDKIVTPIIKVEKKCLHILNNVIILINFRTLKFA